MTRRSVAAAALMLAAIFGCGTIVSVVLKSLALAPPPACLEYAFVALAAARARRPLLALAFALAILLEANALLEQQFLGWATVVVNMPWPTLLATPVVQGLVVAWLALAAGAAMLCHAAAQVDPVAARRTAQGASALLLLLFVVERAVDQSAWQRVGGRAAPVLRPRLVLSGAYTNAVVVARQLREGRSEPQRIASASQQALGPLLADTVGSPTDLVVVIAESLGELRDAAPASRLPTRLAAALGPGYRVSAGYVRTSGFTFEGESRELCGLRAGQPAQLVTVRAGCLPAVLHRRGYHSVAVHGGHERYYNRAGWWRAIGFDEVHLFDGSGPWPTRGSCRPPIANMACDDATLPTVEQALAQRGHPLLAYWVTLDAHVPLALDGPAPERAGCGTTGDERARRRCAWDANATWWLPRLAEAVRRRGRTALLIVGDHPPAYDRPDFLADTVPWAFALPEQGNAPRAGAGHR